MGFASSIVIITLIIFVVIIVTAVIIVSTTTYSGCGSGRDCLTDQVCQNKLCLTKAGGTCVGDFECAQGLVCLNNVCANPPPTNTAVVSPVVVNNLTVQPMYIPPVINYVPPNEITLLPRASMMEMDEPDDEINSCGDHEDAPFAVVSGASSNERDEVVVEELTRMQGVLVIDACTYSNYNIYLLRDGKIIIEEISDNNHGCQPRTVMSTIMLERVVAYDGTIFGVSEGRMYMLSLSSLMTPIWKWEAQSSFPVSIIDLSVTDNEQWLWIQTKQEGYLYHRRLLVERKSYSPLERRVYGSDEHHYLELDRELCQAKLYPQQTVLNNVCYGRATCEGSWVTVGLDHQRKYDRIVMLNWRPYFLRRY